MDNILEIQGLTRRFDGFCLDNVNLSVAPGTITGLEMCIRDSSGTVRCAPTSGSATGWAILLTPKP